MAASGKFAGWRMVAIGFLAQSSAAYMAMATYGAVLPTLERELATTRAMASLALGMMLVSLGVVSPFVGNLLQRVSIRNAMTTGAVLSGAGYVMIAYATDIWQVLAVYTLVIGPAACLLGPLTVSTLVSRWFDRNRGKALAIANVPAFLLVAQPIAAQLVIHGGRVLSFLALAGLFALLIPLTRLVIDRPEQIGQTPLAMTGDEVPVERPGSGHLLTTRELFRDIRFWLLSFAVGILTGAGSAFIAHVAAMATQKGIPLATASTLLSFFGAGAIVGAFVFGWLVDRIGPLVALVINTAIQAVVWTAFIVVENLTLLWMCSALVGAGMGALVALHSTAINQIFGVQNFSRVMGFSYFLKMPFLLGSAPLAGLLFDLSGSYATALLATGIAIGTSSVIFLMMEISSRTRARTAPILSA